jgi:predicted site-specific integrase-resolvase
MEGFVNTSKASALLGVHHRTLLNWDRKGLIETKRLTPNGHRFYNVKKYLQNIENKNDVEEPLDIPDDDRLNICYVRVSSKSQSNDLTHQRAIMVEKYPDYIIIEDIGSGLNLAKRGIKKIIKLGIEGKINELVVAYKDRLTRFGFELIEDIIETYSNGKIIVLNQKTNINPEEELTKDIMTLMNVYVAKMNGLRKYKLKENVNLDENVTKK